MGFKQFLVLISVVATVSAGFAGNAAEYNAENRGIASAITSIVPKLPGLISSPSSSPCTPESGVAINITALQSILPPGMAKIVTPENVETIKNVGRLATLATGAATGNPVAILDLIVFLASDQSPVVPLYQMGKKIVPHLSPDELAAHLPTKETISGTVQNATAAVENQFQKFQNEFQSVFNNLKPSKPVAPAPDSESSVAPPAA